MLLPASGATRCTAPATGSSTVPALVTATCSARPPPPLATSATGARSPTGTARRTDRRGRHAADLRDPRHLPDPAFHPGNGAPPTQAERAERAGVHRVTGLRGTRDPEGIERIRHGHAVLGTYTNDAGATVITSGSTDWAHGLAGRDPQIEQITRNVLTPLGWAGPNRRSERRSSRLRTLLGSWAQTPVRRPGGLGAEPWGGGNKRGKSRLNGVRRATRRWQRS